MMYALFLSDLLDQGQHHLYSEETFIHWYKNLELNTTKEQRSYIIKAKYCYN